VYPDAGVAVNVKLVPWLNNAEQVLPQLMPEGELDTVPDPDSVTETVYCGGGAGLKVAVTD
jgi:hypothetical protein